MGSSSYLDAAQLQGADLNNARLQGAHLGDAQLQGADLRQARLQGADLSRAQLQGADLNGAQLQGADLDRAQLQGADLNGAQMQGAQLPFALLQGADLRQARLQGADLRGAGLQGADLGESEMSDSEFDATFVFRTGVNHANMSTSAIRSVEADRFLLKKGDNSTRIEPLTPADVEGWNAVAMEFAGQKDKSIIAGRFARLKPDFQTAQQTLRITRSGANLRNSRSRTIPTALNTAAGSRQSSAISPARPMARPTWPAAYLSLAISRLETSSTPYAIA